VRGRAGGGEAISADGASLEFRGRRKGSDAGPHGLSLLRSSRWWLVTVQKGPTQIDVRQPVLTGPDALRHDEGSLDFVVCASLVAFFSRGYKRTNLALFTWYTSPRTARGTCSAHFGPHPRHMMCVRPPPLGLGSCSFPN